MAHILDNPVWHALTAHNQPLGTVAAATAFFHPDVSPFVAIERPEQGHLTDLHNAIHFDNVVIFVSNQKMEMPAPWKLLALVDGYQMIYNGPANPVSEGPPITALTNLHVPEMLALTSLTNPGPFAKETIRFGHYEGIFADGKLVAMAGQRLHPEGFAEISAVCTHPEHLGKGYARHLLLRQVNRIQQNNEVPFLHVKGDNARAIGVYESLGFAIRTEIFFHVIQKRG
nr:GNAT family N-acetyltransferase [uncultured Dyadobacter sp.]